jgi:GNAT superfamily N-acetyltransferase
MSTPTITVRPAHTGDYAHLRALLLGAYIEYHDCLPAPAFGAYLADLVDLERRADLGELLVAEHAGVIVGTATFYADASDDGTGWPSTASSIRAMAVRPAARRLGAGRALLDACTERAARRGTLQLCLHTAPFMTAAVRLYEEAGFVRAEAHDVDVSMRVPGATGPLMIKAFRLDIPPGTSERRAVLATATARR